MWLTHTLNILYLNSRSAVEIKVIIIVVVIVVIAAMTNL